MAISVQHFITVVMVQPHSFTLISGIVQCQSWPIRVRYLSSNQNPAQNQSPLSHDQIEPIKYSVGGIIHVFIVHLNGQTLLCHAVNTIQFATKSATMEVIVAMENVLI